MVNGRCKARPLRAILVMAGLDPAIHPFRKCVLRRGWIRGPSPPKRLRPRRRVKPAYDGESRSPDAAQRAVLHGVVRCRAGAVTGRGVWYDPGSAERRYALHRVRETALCVEELARLVER